MALVFGMSACSPTSSTSRGDEATAGFSTEAMSETQVRKDLSDHGYSNVSDLRRSGSGWAGSAVDRNGKRVNLDVDHLGAILTVPPD
jgi:hypothetical protein